MDHSVISLFFAKIDLEIIAIFKDSEFIIKSGYN